LEQTLEEYVKARGGGFKALRQVFEEVANGKVRLVDPSPPRDLGEYLSRLDYSLWFWASSSIVLLTMATVFLSDLSLVFKVVRYIAGSVFVLFLPGYATVELLYPRQEDLSNLERLALSIGLSLAVVPLIGLLLNYTPWGIRLGPVLGALSIYTLVLLFGAAVRKYGEVRRAELIARTPRGRSR